MNVLGKRIERLESKSAPEGDPVRAIILVGVGSGRDGNGNLVRRAETAIPVGMGTGMIGISREDRETEAAFRGRLDHYTKAAAQEER